VLVNHEVGGSSPRAWGKGENPVILPLSIRIIPTCVGKSIWLCRCKRRHSDHPHVRGEKWPTAEGLWDDYGSSPRAWGKDRIMSSAFLQGRIIPTCVGKRPSARTELTSSTDHPHVRGEKSFHGLLVDREHGSSPRAWGKASWNRLHYDGQRIIPTCVGKSAPRWARRSGASDHPHVRGEKTSRLATRLQDGGSSPRAWGKVFRCRRCRRSERIIPTCVGKRSTPKARPGRPTDHPHVRGEKAPANLSRNVVFGSSPRAWGKGSAANR